MSVVWGELKGKTMQKKYNRWIRLPKRYDASWFGSDIHVPIQTRTQYTFLIKKVGRKSQYLLYFL